MDQSVFNTPWGWMGILSSSKGVLAIVLPKVSQQVVEDDLRSASLKGLTRVGGALSTSISRSMFVEKEAQAQLLAFIEGTRRTLDFSIDLSSGSPFQRRVWRAILGIPYGRVRSYRWVADRVGGRQFARAVGNALGANPLPLIVPCHRVVAHDGALGGFAGGLRMKRRLLALEGTLPLTRPNAPRRAFCSFSPAHLSPPRRALYPLTHNV